MILGFALMDRRPFHQLRLIENAGKINALRLPMVNCGAHVQPIHAAHHFIHRPEAKLRHQLPHFFGDEEEVIDHMFRHAGEARTQHRVLRRDANRAGVQMAFAHHDAASRDQGRRGEAEFIRPQQRANHHIAPGAQAAIHLHGNAPAQPIQHECLLRFSQPNLPGRTRMRQRCQRRSARAALIARNRHVIGPRLGNAGRDGADTHF